MGTVGHAQSCFPMGKSHLQVGITASVTEPILHASPVDPLTL